MPPPKKLLRGLVAATHTPFDSEGELNIDAIEVQAEHLSRNKIPFAFIGGTTGECHSLAFQERLELAERWLRVTRGSDVRVVVHVGSNSVIDSEELALLAQMNGAAAIAAFSPSYFKPNSVEALVRCMEKIAAGAPGIPFYFYDIPSMTGVQLPMTAFMEQAAARIPNIAGLKFTNSDLMMFQQLLHHQDGRWDVPFGCDEALLGSLALGGTGAVGSTYNFAAPIYHRLIAAFERGDMETARMEQYRSVQLVARLNQVGFMAGAKEVMSMLGVPVGPPRLPFGTLTTDAKKALRSDLEKMGFFDWIK